MDSLSDGESGIAGGEIDSSLSAGASGGESKTTGGAAICTSSPLSLAPVGTRAGREGDAEAGGDDGAAEGGEAGPRGVASCEPPVGDSDCSAYSDGDGRTVIPGWILGAVPESRPGAT